MSKEKHTPLPWHASRKSRYVSDINHRVIAEIAPLIGFEANAELIVRAVNALPALVKALEEAERFMSYFAGETNGMFVGDGMPEECLEQMRTALAAVRSGT